MLTSEQRAAIKTRTGAMVVNCRYTRNFDVYVGRPSPWGNPYHAPIYDGKRRRASIEHFREWVQTQPALIARAQRELRGKILACWCVPLPCHADVWLEIANANDEN